MKGEDVKNQGEKETRKTKEQMNGGKRDERGRSKRKGKTEG